MVRLAKRIEALGTENAFKKEEVKRQIDANNTHYCDPKGISSLRKAIADHFAKTRKISTDPDWVVVFPGLKPALGFAQEVYCNPGDEVISPSPGFPIYESFVRYLGAIPRPLHLRESTGFTFTAGDLAALITDKTRLIYLNFPSNPTGGVASQEELAAIGEVVRTKGHPDLRLFSDEIYDEILFDGHKHHSIASEASMEERTIVASGFSKDYAWTGGRVGYALFPTVEEADAFKQLNINYFSCIPPYNQEGARIALTHPQREQRIAEMVAVFQERRDRIVDQLNAIEGVHCRTPLGAFYLWPNIAGACERIGAIEAFDRLSPSVRERTSPSTLVQMFALYHHRVAVMDRRSFCSIGSEGQHFLRISIASDLPQLEEGVRRLSNAFDDRSAFLKFVETGEDLF